MARLIETAGPSDVSPLIRRLSGNVLMSEPESECLEGMQTNRGELAAGEEMMAAGLAVALAREGLPFRKAHGVVGSLVGEAQKTGMSLRETAAEKLREDWPAVVARLDALFDPDEAVRAKALPGGTAPDAVRASLAAALEAVGT